MAHKNTQKSAQKVFFFFTYINIYNNSVFFGIWLSVKYKDFHIISNLFQVLEIFILVDKDKLKVQHESEICLLCTKVLHFMLLFFLKGFSNYFQSRRCISS